MSPTPQRALAWFIWLRRKHSFALHHYRTVSKTIPLVIRYLFVFCILSCSLDFGFAQVPTKSTRHDSKALLASAWPDLKPQLRFERVEIDSRLGDFKVYKVVQDSLGFLWFGTQDGIFKYDGYRFDKLEYQSPSGEKRSDKVIRAVLVDRYGNLWYGSDDGVLGHVDTKTGVLQRYTSESKGSPAYMGGRIYALCEDVENGIFVGTVGQGLFRFDRSTNSFLQFTNQPGDYNSLSNNAINALCFDSGKRLWIATDSCLNISDPRTHAFTHVVNKPGDAESIGSDNVIALCKDEFDTIWVGTKHGLAKVTSIVRGRPTFSRLNMPDDYVKSILREDVHSLWTGTQEGVIKTDLQTLSQQQYLPEKDLTATLPASEIRDIFRDRSGVLWICTIGGIAKLNRGAGQFTNYVLSRSLSESQHVYSLCEGTDGSIWFCNYDGLFLVDGGKKGVRRFSSGQGKAGSLPINTLTCLLPDRSKPPSAREGVLWIGTWDGGILKFDIRLGRFTSYLWAQRVDDNNVVYSLYQDAKGILWIGTLKEGLVRFDPGKPMFERMGLENTPIRTIIAEGEDTLWIGTESAGISRFDKRTGEFFNLSNVPSNPNSLPDTYVYSLHVDHDRNLWVGTRMGLSRKRRNGDTFDRVVQADGVVDKVQGILEDNHGVLWVALERRGIVRFDPKSGTYASFDENDGLLAEGVNGAIRLKDGMFLCKSYLGLILFDPDRVAKHPYAAPLYLTSMDVFDDFSRTQLPAHRWKPIVLPYDSSFFSFEFVLLDFNAPQKNRYQYKLEGLDADWVNAGTRRSASYTKVEHGKYTFLVRGAGREGTWGSGEASVEVTVTPPFWKTWWFRVVVAVFAISIVAGGYEYRLSRIREVDGMRQQIAEDLHDEIGSNLGTIALLSDVMKRGKTPEESKDISEIGTIARRTAEAMRDIIWVLKFNKEQVADLPLKMRDTASEMLRDVNHSFETTNGSIGHVEDMRFRRNLLLIYREALHNIIKYARATEVKISLEQQDGALRLHIKDNGVGFDENAVRRGNGLKNMRDRATRIGGNIEITSIPGKGTTLSLTAKIP